MIPILLMMAALSPIYLRVELVEAPVAPGTVWQEVAKWLGIRRAARVKPAVGTKLVVQATGYASSPYQTDASPCITAAGTVVRQGVVASNALPMGTLLDINGQPFIVEDRMNARYGGNYLDIWFPATSQALEFGRRKLEITVVGYGEPGQPLIQPNPSPAAVVVEAAGEAREEAPTMIRTEKDLVPVISRAAKNWWERVLNQIGARLTGNVDRYDVDCSHL